MRREDQDFARDTMHYDLLKDQINTGQGQLESNYFDYPRKPSKLKLMERMR